MRRMSSAWGGIVSRRIWSKNSERGRAAALEDLGHVGGVEAAAARLEVPRAGGLDLAEQLLGVERVGLGEVAERGQQRVDVRGASRAVTAWASWRSLLEVVGVDDAHQAEVEEADLAVVEQQVVARVRVAGGAARCA